MEKMPELVACSGDSEDLGIALQELQTQCLRILEEQTWSTEPLICAADCLDVSIAKHNYATIVRLASAICKCCEIKLLVKFLDEFSM